MVSSKRRDALRPDTGPDMPALSDFPAFPAASSMGGTGNALPAARTRGGGAHAGRCSADRRLDGNCRAAVAGAVQAAPPVQLHALAAVRRREGVSLRNLARRWRISIRLLREEERPETDLTLTALYRWQAALGVPLADLLPDCVAPPVDPVWQRAALVKAMKTAVTIRERSKNRGVQRLVKSLIDQLLAMMPELADVAPWHEPGQRPKPKEHGRLIRLGELRTAYRR